MRIRIIEEENKMNDRQVIVRMQLVVFAPLGIDLGKRETFKFC